MSILDAVARRWRRAGIATIAAVAAMSMTVPSAFANMNGIDVASWQCGIDMNAVPGDFAIVKTTQGTGYVNPCMTAQLEGARSSGKSIGVYHYAGGLDANAEADHFLEVSDRYIRKGIIVLDWESYQNRAWGNGSWVRTWVNRVHDRTGVWPVIYVQASAVYQIPSDVRRNCMIWKAQYASSRPTGYQSNPWNLGSHGEGMLQYTANGRLSGYDGYLDLNLFLGDQIAWNKIATGGESSGTSSGGSSGGSLSPAPTPTPSISGTTAELAQRVLRGEFGNNPQRRAALGSRYAEVQAYINQHYGSSSSPSNGRSVVVRRGDTIASIAKRTGLYPLSAWRVPSGNINRIYPGQTVTFGGSGSSASTSGTSPQASTSTTRVTVRLGDTISAIAKRTGLYPLSAWSAPSGNINRIYPGQVVTYRGSSSKKTASTSSGYRYRTVKRGDTLSGMFGSDWKRVARLNGISNYNLIYPGQVLRY